jgi:hypothetical protein
MSCEGFACSSASYGFPVSVSRRTGEPSRAASFLWATIGTPDRIGISRRIRAVSDLFGRVILTIAVPAIRRNYLTRNEIGPVARRSILTVTRSTRRKNSSQRQLGRLLSPSIALTILQSTWHKTIPSKKIWRLCFRRHGFNDCSVGTP